MKWKKKPEIEQVKQCARICSALDAVLNWDSPDIRYYTYYPKFKPGLEAIHLYNGGGDEGWGVFGEAGAIFKIFDHESKLSPYQRRDGKPWPGIYEGLSAELMAYLKPKDVQKDDVTLCVYRLPGKSWTETKPVDPPEGFDGGWWLLTQIHLTPADWLSWAGDYYERDLPEQVVRKVYKEGRLDEAAARALLEEPEDFSFRKVRPELVRLGMCE